MKNPTLYILDECQHRLFNIAKELHVKKISSSLIAQFVDQSRFTGIGLVSSPQQPSSLIKGVINNSWLKVCFKLSSGTEIKVMQEAMGLTDEQAELIHHLDRGQAICKTATGFSHPMLVQLNNVFSKDELKQQPNPAIYEEKKHKFLKSIKIRKSLKDIPNVEVKYSKSYQKKTQFKKEVPKRSDNLTNNRKLKIPTQSDKITRLLNVWLNLSNPFLTQGQIMNKAGILSGSQQTKLKNIAIREGLITIHKLQVGKTYTSIWEPLDKAYELIKLKKQVFSSKGGYLHQFIAHHVVQWAKNKGKNASIEYLLENKKAVDVAVDTGEGMDFYEIVVSKPYEKELSNIEKDLATSPQPENLIFLVTDNKVKATFEAMLTSAEITEQTRNKVEVKLAGDYLVS